LTKDVHGLRNTGIFKGEDASTPSSSGGTEQAFSEPAIQVECVSVLTKELPVQLVGARELAESGEISGIFLLEDSPLLAGPGAVSEAAEEQLLGITLTPRIRQRGCEPTSGQFGIAG
jgi:hypothetical protein